MMNLHCRRIRSNGEFRQMSFSSASVDRAWMLNRPKRLLLMTAALWLVSAQGSLILMYSAVDLYSKFENENQFTEAIVDSKTASTSTESISTKDDELLDPNDMALDNWATEYGTLCWTPESSPELGGSTKDDELLDPNDMALDNWATEYGTLCWTPESSAELGGSTTSKAPTILSQEQLNVSCKAGITTGEESSSRTDAIQDLEAAMRQLTPETRICFRDAFYRLAGSINQRQLVNERGSMMTDEGSTGSARADVIDKIVADLLLDRISSNLHQ